MSYCVRCGVELADYHNECPLCKTEVIDPTRVDAPNIDYPDYHTNPTSVSKRANKVLAALILSTILGMSAAITILVNILTAYRLTWSLICCLSCALVWYTVAFPLFKKKNTFFRLFTLDSIGVIIFLLVLNYIITGNFLWSKYTTFSIILLWVILAGFFRPQKIRRFIPIVLYYVICFIFLFLVTTLFINSRQIIVGLVIPIFIVPLVLSLISYFVIKAIVHDPLGIAIVVFLYASVFVVLIELVITNYLNGSMSLSWSIIVVLATLPLIATSVIIKKSRELRALIIKKIHQ